MIEKETSATFLQDSFKPLNSMIVDVQRIQKPWQKVIPRAREYHHPFVAHMMRNGYSPAYLQVNYHIICHHKMVIDLFCIYLNS